MLDQLREQLKAAGQEQLLQFWDQLSGEEQTSLSTQIEGVDLEAINTYYR